MIKNVLSRLGSVRIALAIGVGLPLLVVSGARAQEATPTPATAASPTTGTNLPAPTGGEATAERVVVTGSNIPTADEVGPNPVDTYRSEDIQKLGIRTTTDLIQKLPSATGGSITENISNGGDGRAEINLRGILAKETLVLIDGRRAALVGFAGNTVDLNQAPSQLIDHIDVLKDGASAIYGSDAVSGVFAIYFKHKFRGLEIYGSYANTNLGSSNDQREVDGSILAGTGDDKTDIVVFAEAYDRAAIYSRDRGISASANFAPFGGAIPLSGNFAGRVLNFRVIGDVPNNVVGTHPYANPNNVPLGKDPVTGLFNNPNVAAPGQPLSRNAAATLAGYRPLIFPTTKGKIGDFFNFSAFTPSFPAADRQHFYGSFTRDICDKWLTVFADFKYFRNFFDSGLAAAPFTPDVFTTGPDFVSGIGGKPPVTISSSGISVPTQNPYNPFSSGSRTVNGVAFVTGVRYRGLEAGIRTDKITTNNYMFTGGIRGSFNDIAANDLLKTWGYEIGFRYNRDDRLERFGGIINNNALRTALLSTDPATAFDAFGRNLNGSGQFGRTNFGILDKIFVTTNHNGYSDLTLEDGKLYGDLWKLPAGPLSFAIGGEHRREATKDAPDPLTASGQTTGATNFQPTSGNRDVWAMYGELRIPITSPTWNFPGLYNLEFDLAERYEYFSDFGPTEKPKFSVRYQPIDSSLTLRATYNEAFHAPTLSDLFTSTAQSFPIVRDPKNLTPDAQVQETLGGNRNLGPENAYEYTAGAVYTPKFFRGLTVSLDFYHIDLRDVAATLSPQFILDQANLGRAPFTGQVQRDDAGAIVNIDAVVQNLARIVTEGFDYEMIYQFETSRLGHGDFGVFTYTINGTYLSRYEFSGFPGGKEHDATGSGPGGSIGNLTHNRLYTSLFYDKGGLSTGLTMNFTGQYQDVGLPGGRDKVREWYPFDAIVQYTFNFPAPEGQQEVAGFSKTGGKNVVASGKDKNVAPVSTAAYAECGWRAWLNQTQVTLGMNNIFDDDPPFVANGFANGYDEATANLKGRQYYVALRKRF